MNDAPAISTEGGFIETFRARKDELGLSNAHCDHLLNRAGGYVDHYLGRADKALVSEAFTQFCELFALEFVPRENVEALRRMEAAWEGRAASQIRVAQSISKHLLDRVRPLFYAEKAAQLTNGRKNIPQEKRRRIARKAARARWRRKSANAIQNKSRG